MTLVALIKMFMLFFYDSQVSNYETKRFFENIRVGRHRDGGNRYGGYDDIGRSR